MADLVTRQDEEGLCWLTLNRPDKLNALTVGMFQELRRHVIDLKKDESIVIWSDMDISYAGEVEL